MARSYVFKNIKPREEIILDFNDIKVMTPSWLDEFISGIKSEYTNKIVFENTENETVSASLKTVLTI
jgi:hypothetical protein